MARGETESGLIDRLIQGKPSFAELDRRLISLSEDGWLAREIAEEFGMTPSAVEQRLFRAGYRRKRYADGGFAR